MRRTNDSGSDWDADLEDGETIAYSGHCLAELLWSGELRSLPEPAPARFEDTVVMSAPPRPTPAPVSERPEPRSAVTFAPVAYTLSHASPTGTVEAVRRGRASRLGGAVSLAALGVLLGLAGSSLLSEPQDVRAGVPSQVERHARVDERIPLVIHGHQKALPKRPHVVVSIAAARGGRSLPSAAQGVAGASSEADQAAADAQLLRAAQLERPF